MAVYSILDKVSKKWSSPFVLENDETAIRSWKHDCQKVPAEYLKDYDLYWIGYWNETALLDVKNGDVLYSPFNASGKTQVPKLILSGQSLIDEDQKVLDFEEGK